MSEGGFPSISVGIRFGDDVFSGRVTLASVGFALHQLWIYSSMFGASTVFGAQAVYIDCFGANITMPFMVSLFTLCVCLMFEGITDQRFKAFYRDKRTIIASASAMCVGTLLLMWPFSGPIGTSAYVLWIISGLLTGAGSSILLLAWGVRFACSSMISITINSMIGYALAFGSYAFLIVPLAFPLCGMVVALLPLAELLILLYHPVIGVEGNKAYEKFRPLPIKKGSFAIKFGLPFFVFGFALGVLRQLVLNINSTIDSYAAVTAMAFSFAILFVVNILLAQRNDGSGFNLKAIVPLLAIAILFIPMMGQADSTFASTVVMTMYLTFEALVWIYFGQISQAFRISPVLVFGFGRSLSSFATIVVIFVGQMLSDAASTLPYGENSMVLFLMLTLIVAFALLPNGNDVKDLARGIRAADGKCPVVDLDLNGSELDLPGELKPVELPPEDDEGGEAPSEQKVPSAGSVAQVPASPVATTPVKEGAGPLTGHVTSEERRKGWFRERCEIVANTYLLSQREEEVLFYLAKGFNAALIQEKLYISEGTAKTHMRHIYHKLNVHTQQELMRLVETTEVPGDTRQRR